MHKLFSSCAGRVLSTSLTAAALVFLVGCDSPRQEVALHQRDAVPERLSEWHIVEAVGGELSSNVGVTPYDLNTPLFTDYAHKLRTVWMPAGSSAQYGEEAFVYPVGTVLSKTFYYPKDTARSGAVLRTDDYSNDYAPGKSGEALDLSRVQLLETRLLVKRADGWQALPYVWNAEQTDATLEIAGDVRRLTLVDAGGDAAEFAPTKFTYVVPDANQCAGCHADNHTDKSIEPLGPRARHLNKAYAYGGYGTKAYTGGVQNQLLHWQQIGYLSGLPELSAIPHNADYADASQPLEVRARAYLDINCGHCHNPAGAADTSGLMLNHDETDLRRLGLCKPPVAAGTGSGHRRFAIVPGAPQESILNFRVESTDPGAMMPELGRGLVHEEGVELLREWVSAMPGSCS